MQSDVLSSELLTATGLVKTCYAGGAGTPAVTQNLGRCRVRGVYYSALTTGTVTFRETATGPIRLIFAITTLASGLIWLPEEGILFNNTPHMTLNSGSLTGLTVFYS
jgi:hypothetical protein